MGSPETPGNEDERQKALKALGILDSDPEERFDRFTRLARRLFEVPIAVVSLVDCDRQWFKSITGLEVRETPRSVSFCGHAILGPEVMVVPDAQLDDRFRDNPLVTGAPYIRFYAGHPLTLAPDIAVGTLCLIDTKPRHFGEEDRIMLQDLGHMVITELLTTQYITVDVVTGLSNRLGLIALGGHALSLCRRMGKAAVLVAFDLGPVEDDSFLQAFGQVLIRTLRDADLVARVRDGVFVSLVSDCPADELPIVLGRVEEKYDGMLKDIPGGGSKNFRIGSVAFDPRRHASIESLLEAAEANLQELQ